MRYRVDDLAARCGVSVDTVRFYQGRGLLPAPERAGRVAWYGDEHVRRLEQIRELKASGLTLAAVERVLAGTLKAPEAALATALSGDAAPRRYRLKELEERTGVSLVLLQALEREGLLVPQTQDDAPVYTDEDANAIAAGLALLEAGVPLSELLDLARRHDAAMRTIADHAVDLFARFVWDAIAGVEASEEDRAARLVEAFHAMLPATATLVGYHFRRLLLASAQTRLAAPKSPMPPGAGGAA